MRFEKTKIQHFLLTSFQHVNYPRLNAGLEIPQDSNLFTTPFYKFHGMQFARTCNRKTKKAAQPKLDSLCVVVF